MRTLTLTLTLILCWTCSAASQTPATPREAAVTPWSFFPDHLLFRPLYAHHEEARVGLQQELGSTKLKLGIGGTLDAIEYVSGVDTLRWGPDLFIYALSNEIRGVLFKIGAADGYFGMHISFANGSRWSFRFRAIHHSAHQVDGNYDPESMTWADGREPFNFTRNYGEVDAAYDLPVDRSVVRLYSGIAVSVWNRPRAVRPVSSSHGVELIVPGTPLFYVAWDVTLMGIPSYVATSNIEAGLKLGRPDGRGVRLFLNYFNGLDTFGAFYDRRLEYLGAGFSFDLW